MNPCTEPVAWGDCCCCWDCSTFGVNVGSDLFSVACRVVVMLTCSIQLYLLERRPEGLLRSQRSRFHLT